MAKLKLDTTPDYMNVWCDAGYLLHYTIFGAFNMWKKQYPALARQICPEPVLPRDAPDLTIDDKFQYCLQKKMEDNFDRIFYMIKKNVAGSTNMIGIRPRFFFVYDARGGKYWRKVDLFPEYKLNRKKGLKVFNVGKAMDYLRSIILPKLDIVNYYGFREIQVDRAEADDILMTIIRRSTHSNNIIVATDHDYVQVFDKARMFDMTGKEITIEYISNKAIGTEEMTPQTYLKCKIMAGDGSDNIPGIFPRTGFKTAWKLLNNPDRLRERLTEDAAGRTQFKKNIALIDCTKIPTDIQKEIIYAFQQACR